MHGLILNPAGSQGFFHAAADRVVLAGDALGIDPEQNVHAVTGPRGDLWGRDAAVEPGRHCGVPKVVWPARERRGNLWLRQTCSPCDTPDPAVKTFRQGATTDTSEEPAIRCRPMLVEVTAQQGGQLRRARNYPDLVNTPMLQLTRFPPCARLAPRPTGRRRRRAQIQLTPSGRREGQHLLT
jgi:hypothetical protein